MDNEKVKKVTDFLKDVNEGLTKKDFLLAFKNVVDIITNIGKKLLSDNEAMKSDFADLKRRLTEADNNSRVNQCMTECREAVATAVTNMMVQSDMRMKVMEAQINEIQDGEDADEEGMMLRLQELIPKIEDIILLLPKLGTELRNSLELLHGDERLTVSSIKGIEDLVKAIMKTMPQSSAPGMINGRVGIQLFLDGIKKGTISNFNLVGGTGVSIAYSKVGGQDTITINASGGGGSGVTVETPPEAPTGLLTVFTVSAEPQWIVSDGITLYAGKGYTYSSLQVTLDVAPSQYIRAII